MLYRVKVRKSIIRSKLIIAISKISPKLVNNYITTIKIIPISMHRIIIRDMIRRSWHWSINYSLIQ